MNHLDIEKLYEAKIITTEQRDEIISRFLNRPTPPVSAPDKALVNALSTLAAFLIAGGSLVLVVSHWQEVSGPIKSAGCMLLMALAWLGCWLLRTKKPAVSEGLGLLGACMWGVNIWLNVSLYDIQGSETDFFFIFFIGILPIPFLLRQRVLIGVVEICSFILLSLMIFGDKQAYLSLHSLLEGCALGSVMLLYSGLLLVWWLVGESCRRHQGVCSGYYWISTPTFLIFMAYIHIYLLYYAHPLPVSPWLLAIPAVVFAGSWLTKPLEGTRSSRGAVAAAACALPLIAIAISSCTVFHDLLAIFACSAFSLIFTIVGVRSNRRSWINFAALMMCLVFINLMYHITESLSDSGLILIAVGFSVLAFAFLLEGQRRRLIKKVSDHSTASPK